MKIEDLVDSVNIAADLDEDQLIKIGQECWEGYDADLKSRAHLEELLEKWTATALQVADKKTFPWTGASNVKFPLLATASMQFAARAYPTLVPSNGKIVKVKVVTNDPQGELYKRSERVAKFMSYQIMEEMEEWEEEMDKLLITLPITGTAFKKTYWCPLKQRNVSCLILPKSLVVNYWAKSLEDAERASEIIPMSKRKLKERMLAGVYIDQDLSDPDTFSTAASMKDQVHGNIASQKDETTPYTIIEQHTFLDLDGDGYTEPYVVVFEETSKKVLRIAPRYTAQDVMMDDKGKVVRIVPNNYYTKYGFVPNPDGGFYDIGFGRLLGPINDTVDTLINQLIDAGSLSNLQAGFIGKGLRMKMGDARFTPGEWKPVNATGDDIKKQIFPLPTREPSMVLFQLLQYLVTAGKELASVAEIFVGKMPGQNTPATTTMASIEQGMKVFTAVYKRVYRSLTQEFRKLYKLNAVYLNPETVVEFLQEPVQQADFAYPENRIFPAADPSSVSFQEKQAKVQAVGQLIALGTINPLEYTKMYLEAFEVPGADRLIAQPQQGPSPEQQQMEAEAALAQEEARMKMQMEQEKFRLKAAETSQKLAIEKAIGEQKIQHAAIMGNLKLREQAMGSQVEAMKGAQQHSQSMQQSQEAHAVKLQQMKQQEKAKPKPKKGKD